MAPGGVLIFNDYGGPRSFAGMTFPGVRRAVDEFAASRAKNVSVGAPGKPPGLSNAFIAKTRRETAAQPERRFILRRRARLPLLRSYE